MALTFPAAYHNRNVIFWPYSVYCFVVVNNVFLLLQTHKQPVYTFTSKKDKFQSCIS